jgi:hypothetical protein
MANMGNRESLNSDFSENESKAHLYLESLKERVTFYYQSSLNGNYDNRYELEYRTVREQMPKKEYINFFENQIQERKKVEGEIPEIESFSIGEIVIQKNATQDDPTIIANVEIVFTLTKKGKSISEKVRDAWIYEVEDWYHLLYSTKKLE